MMAKNETSGPGTVTPPKRVPPAAWIAAGLLIGVLLACPCGFMGGWMGKGWSGTGGKLNAIGGVLDNDDKDLAWQELQDLLAQRGMRTGRGQGSGGMWFSIGQSGEVGTVNFDAMAPIWRGDHSAAIWGLPGPEEKEAFLVTKLASPAAAKAAMTQLKDERQRESLAWRNFLFEGGTKTLTDLKKVLP